MYKYLTRCSKHKYNGINHKRNIDIFNNIKKFEIITGKHHKQLKSKQQFWRDNFFPHKYDRQRQQVFKSATYKVYTNQ